MAAAAVATAPKSRSRTNTTSMGAAAGEKGASGKQTTCAQRIEVATVKKTQGEITLKQSWDAEALFRKHDSEDTQLLSRGSVTELLREVGLETKLGEAFSATAQLIFDAHSADSHFLSFNEFRQVYYNVSRRHPDLLPRPSTLTIEIHGARGLPAADINGKSDPFCTVQVLESETQAKKPWSKSQTKYIPKTLDPWWGEIFCDKYAYNEGDNLLFEVFDYDPGSKPDLLARGVLQSKKFHCPGGFEDRLPLTCMQPDDKGKYSPQLKLLVRVNALPAPPPNLTITIRGAKGLPPADPNGKSDPYLFCQLIGKDHTRFKTKVIKKTLEPIWDEETDDKCRYEGPSDDTEGDRIYFEVRDYDKGGKFEMLGKAIMENHQFHKPGGFDGDLPLTDVLTKGYMPTVQLKVTVRAIEEAAAAAGTAKATAPPSAPPPAAAAPVVPPAEAALAAEAASGTEAGKT